MNEMNASRYLEREISLKVLCATVILLALGACSSPSTKGYYPAAADQQLRSAAEAAASPGVGANATADTASTYLKLVEQMQRDGLWFASIAHIDSLEKRWGASPESIRLRADALRQTEQTEASRQLYGKLMGTPFEGAGYHGLGLIAGAQQNFPQAVDMMERAQRLNPTDALLLSDLGYARMRAGQIPAARVPLMQALQLQPDNPRVQVNVALYLQASGQSEQATALMDSRSMPPATRSAIVSAARQLSPTADRGVALENGPLQVAAVSRAILEQPAGEALVLKTAGWPRRVPVMVRPDPAAAAAATDTSTTPAASAIGGPTAPPDTGVRQ
ncbi:pilus assembly protein [soil metagenome]